MGLSLRFKIIFITVVVLIFAIGATVIAGSYVFAQAYSELLQSRTVVIGQGVNSQLNRLLELGLPLEDLTGFEKQLQETLITYDDISYVMVVDLNGTVLFHNDRTQQGTTITDVPSLNAVQSGQETIQVYSDQNGEFQDVFIPIIDRSGDHVGAIRLGFPTELITETITQLAIVSGVIAIVSLAVATIILIFAINAWVTNPLTKLLTAIQQIIGGEQSLETRVEIDSQDELGELGAAFNTMATQLNDLIHTLEHKVAERTQGIETAATLSEKLVAILNLEQLFEELVSRIHNAFGYYYVGAYLVDEDQQNLVIAAGTGQAGFEMKKAHHTLSMNKPNSLITRAARTGQTITIDNVLEMKDWVSNPFLPDTRSEMTIPIILDGAVVGVLDVQENIIAGLDASDANLLRLLTNQVAVAIRNARLFFEVETALAEAQAVQEQYLQKSWDKTSVVSEVRQYLYAQPTATPLDEETQQNLVKAQQNVSERQQAVVVTDDNGIKGTSTIAPIILRDKAIGTLQLHTSNLDQAWDEDDLTMLETIAEQFAQTAENLRLFDQTRQRAGREQTIREITDKMRAATNIEELIRTAATQLGEHLFAGHAVVELGVEDEPNANGL